MHISVFIVGLVGVVLAGWSFCTSCLELHGLLVLNVNGPHRLAAISNIVRDAFLFVVQSIIIYVGAVVAVQDTSSPGPWIPVSMLLTANLMVDRLRRMRVAQYYEEEQRAKSFTHSRAGDRA